MAVTVCVVFTALLIACEIALCAPVQMAAARARVDAQNRRAARGASPRSAVRESKARAKLDSAGIDLSVPLYMICLVVLATLLALVAATRAGVLGAILAVVLTWIASEAFLRIRTKSQTGDFEEQLGQALPMVASGVRIGMTFEQALSNVAETMEDPFRDQVRQFSRERAYGATLTVAIENLAARVKSKNMDDLATVVMVQSETGGKMADVLESIAVTIQRREKLRRHIASATADGRMSAVIIAAIPVVLLVVFTLAAPDYVGVLYTTPAGWAMLAVSAVLVVVGLLVIRSLYQIKIY